MKENQPINSPKARKALRFILPFVLFGLIVSSGLAQEPIPQSPPDAGTGLTIFADRCANCHGVSGAGDGEMAGQLENPPRNFTAPEFRQTAVPADMFATISNGRIEAGMPPFGPTSSNAISAENRWNLVAAVYSLSTPADALARGQAVYETNCQSCHGEQGQGDGPDAAAQETPPTDLTNFAYWYNRSNEMVQTALIEPGIPAHTYTLDEAAVADVVDYSRAFSYEFIDPDAPVQPIEAAVISGLVTNGTTGAVAGEGTAVLRAFTPEFAEAMTLTTTVGVDGRYVFDLSLIPPNWIYMTNVAYNGLTFNSSPDMLSPDAPQLALPVTVYDQTTDAGVVSIEQIHVIMDFVDGQVQVSEVYTFNNDSEAVFVGENGDAERGTIELVLPAGAQNISFGRAFTGLDNFLPADEFFQTDRGWADTVPLRPGNSVMNLLVSYMLPYEDGMTVAHPLFYETANARVMMPDVGVTVADEVWTAQEPQAAGPAGTFLTFLRAGLAANEALSFELDGRPQTRPTDALGNTVAPVSNTTTGMVIGGAVLLLVAISAVIAVRSWRETAVANSQQAKQEYLQAIADLDDAYSDGQLETAVYNTHRQQLITELATLWQPTGG